MLCPVESTGLRFIALKRSVSGILRHPPGGTPHMKGVGMLVVSLRGINFGLTPSYLAVKVSFRVAREKM